MIERPDDEIAAWLDGEHVSARRILALLEHADVLEQVRDVMRVRAAFEDDDVVLAPRAVDAVGRAIVRARWYARIPRTGWAAVLIVACGLVFALARRGPATTPQPVSDLPPVDLVARFPTS